MKTSSAQMINKNKIIYLDQTGQKIKPIKGRIVSVLPCNPVSRLSGCTNKCENWVVLLKLKSGAKPACCLMQPCFSP
jgi:hypothetical protein